MTIATQPPSRAETIALGIAIAIVVAAGALLVFDGPIDSTSTLAITIGAVACAIGAIHGATDFSVARRTLTTLPQQLSYLATYILLAVVATLALLAWPLPMLFLLLALGAWHFGLWHVQSESNRIVRHLMALSIGMVPIWSAAMFQPDQCRAIFVLLAAEHANAIVQGLQAAWPLLVGGLVSFALRFLQTRIGNARSAFSFRLSVLHIVLSAALFAVLPVFLAFAVFFALLHAPLHSRDVLVAPVATRNRLIAEAALLTVCAVALLAPILATSFTREHEAIPALVLAGLLAITVPHALNGAITRAIGRNAQKNTA